MGTADTADTNQLRDQLRQVNQSLDAALARVTPMDEKLKNALVRMYTTRGDELGTLLSQVSQKASILDSARMRAEFAQRQLNNHRGAEGESVTTAASVARVTSQEVAQEPVSARGMGLPQAGERNGVTLTVDDAVVAGERLRVRFHLTAAIHFTLAGESVGDDLVGVLPMLTGVQAQGEDDRPLRLVSRGEASTTGNPAQTQTLSGSLEFAPADNVLTMPTRAIRLNVEAVLFAECHAVTATPWPVRLVQGPWQFQIPMSSME